MVQMQILGCSARWFSVVVEVAALMQGTAAITSKSWRSVVGSASLPIPCSWEVW